MPQDTPATQSPKFGTRNESSVPPIVREVLRSSGQPLDARTRAFMEQGFGHSFSDVRLHTDAKANESAQAVKAHAYAVGRNLVFVAGQYMPETRSGRHLLAHELTHFLQQAQQSGEPSAVSPANSTHEQEANHIAEQMMRMPASDESQSPSAS